MFAGSDLLLIVMPVVGAFVSGRIYAIVGGDDWVAKHTGTPKVLLHVIHHWQAIFVSIGIAFAYASGYESTSPITEILTAVFWLGLGLFLEDFIFHIAHGGWWGEPEK